MADQRTNIRVGADTREAEKKLKGFLKDFEDRLKTGFGIDFASRIVNTMVRAVSLLETGLRTAFHTGIAFNSTLENATNALAGILRTISPESFGTFNKSLEASRTLVRMLKEEARLTIATFEDLVQASQGLIAPAINAGVPLEKIPALVSMVSRAVSAMMPNAPGYQIMQEGRALLTGDINANSSVAKYLEITSEHVKLAREQGRVYEFLNEKLGGLNEAAEAAMNTLSGLISNLTDELKIGLGDAMHGATEQIKVLIRALTEFVATPEFKRLAGLVGDTGARAAQYAGAATMAAARNQPALDYLTTMGEAGVTTPIAGALGFATGGMGGARGLMAANLVRLFNEFSTRVTSDVFDSVLDVVAPWHGPLGTEERALPTIKVTAQGSPADDGEARAKAAADWSKSMSGGLSQMSVSPGEHGLYYTAGGSMVQRELQNIQRSIAKDIGRVRELMERGLKLDPDSFNI